MGARVGVVTVGEDDWERVGEGVRATVEDEVKKLLEDSYTRARKTLTEHREELERLADALVEYETLTLDEVRAAIAGEDV
ncbi:hypothetical protein HK405_001792, partial [Cladochytrium tenue]